MEVEGLIVLRRHLLPSLVLCLAAVLLAAPADGQKKDKDLRPNDPSTCPYCLNDPALMQAAGIVSHGGFEFGKNDTAKIDAFLTTSDLRWIETPMFKIGFGLGPQKVKFEEKKKLFAELSRLAAVLPAVKPETTTLDPWLRAHLYAQRCEDVLARFLKVMGAEGAQYADGSGAYTGTYLGEGPYLGQKAKYEFMVLPSEPLYVQFLVEHVGQSLRVGYRWHNVARGAIGYYCHGQEGQLRQDSALHGNVAFNLTHNLYDGYYHYTYDTPIWLHEGLAHVMEREIDERNNTFDSGEGGIANMTSKANWKPDVLRLIASGEAPRMAELMQIKSYAELELRHHFVTWSLVDYLLASNPEGFAAFLRSMKLCMDPTLNIPSGANLPEWHRTKFKEHLGMSYAEFDEAWRAWAQLNYKTVGPKGADPAAPALPPGRGVPPGGGG